MGFHCMFCGDQLIEEKLGFVYCEKCKVYFLLSQNEEGRQILTEVFDEKGTNKND